MPTVAIKVLPAAFSADPDRMRRFQQEAEAAGRLNHPSILATNLTLSAHERSYAYSYYRFLSHLFVVNGAS